LIVTAWSSTIALVVGATFAFALDRYQFRFKTAIEGVLVSPLVVPHFTVGLGFLILAVQVGLARSYASSSPAMSFSSFRSCCEKIHFAA
jgi:putative spermidine/putrescine transport system permease protein